MVKVFKCSQRVYPCLLVTLWPTCCKTFPISTQFVQTEIQTTGFYSEEKVHRTFNSFIRLLQILHPLFILLTSGWWKYRHKTYPAVCDPKVQEPGVECVTNCDNYQPRTNFHSVAARCWAAHNTGVRMVAGHPEQCSEQLYGTAQWPARTLQTNHRTHRLPGHRTGARAETSSVHCLTSMFIIFKDLGFRI